MNFDLSELDKVSDKQTTEARKKLPNILAKAVRDSTVFKNDFHSK